MAVVPWKKKKINIGTVTSITLVQSDQKVSVRLMIVL